MTINKIIGEEIQKIHEAGYYDDEGVIKLYHRVGVKNANSYPELIKSVQQHGLITSDNGEVGSAIWFSNNFKDYGENGQFVVAVNFDTATNGVANNKYGIVYDGHNAYAYENIAFEDLEIIKIPVGIIGYDHALSNIKAIKYINEDVLTLEAINSGKIEIKFYDDVFNTYVQPYINIPDFLNQIKVNSVDEIIGEEILNEQFGFDIKAKTPELNQEFRNWFGSSKVLDGRGQPAICYHQTTGDFNAFKAGGGDVNWSGSAMWFGTDKNRKALPAYKSQSGSEGASVMPVYLRVEKPLIINSRERYEDIIRDYKIDNDFPLRITPEQVAMLKEDGNDGIFFSHDTLDKNSEPRKTSIPDEIIVFDPDQIKSVYNDGTWNRRNDNILNEVISLLEGVGDKYAEKQFGIPDTDKQYQDMGVPDANMGEKMCQVWGSDYKGSKSVYGYIYKNPKTLNGFDAEVRAIGLANGDLYVAQQDGAFIHVHIELALEKKIGYLDDYIELHRVGTTNDFGASDTLIHKLNTFDFDIGEYLEALQVRHPQFNFSTEYYLDLGESLNEVNEKIGDKYQANIIIDIINEELYILTGNKDIFN